MNWMMGWWGLVPGDVVLRIGISVLLLLGVAMVAGVVLAWVVRSELRRGDDQAQHQCRCRRCRLADGGHQPLDRGQGEPGRPPRWL